MNNTLPSYLTTSKGISIVKRSIQGWPEHSHDFYEIEYILSGSGTLILNDNRYRFSENTLMFFTPLDFEKLESKSDITLLNISFNTEWIPDSIINYLTMPAVMHNYYFPYVERLTEEYNNSEKYNNTVIDNLLSVLLVDISRGIRKKEIEQGKRHSKNVRAALRYIQLHFRENITLDDVSKHVYTASTYLSSIFKKHTGKTFSEYLVEQRLMYARRLLCHTNHSITDIGFESGFSTYSHFSRCFKKKYGITPKQMRSEYKSFETTFDTPMDYFLENGNGEKNVADKSSLVDKANNEKTHTPSKE